MIDFYLECLGYSKIPSFLPKYLETPSLKRLQSVGYFCGMDYASKDIYNFSEYISRYIHSLTVALLTHKYEKDEKSTLAGLYHDISTPCFSHVIDYMHKDYENQEKTEGFIEEIIKNDKYLLALLKQDGIDPDEIINFKKYPIVDNNRPKLCADRLDGVILTSIGWTKNITHEDISTILNDIDIFTNEDNAPELGFKHHDIAKKVLTLSDIIDEYCHTKEDNYMMELLAKITSLAINLGIIKYEDLYKYNEPELFNLFSSSKELEPLLKEFKTIKKEDIPLIELPKVKKRELNPLVNGIRIKRL